MKRRTAFTDLAESIVTPRYFLAPCDHVEQHIGIVRQFTNEVPDRQKVSQLSHIAAADLDSSNPSNTPGMEAMTSHLETHFAFSLKHADNFQSVEDATIERWTVVAYRGRCKSTSTDGSRIVFSKRSRFALSDHGNVAEARGEPDGRDLIEQLHTQRGSFWESGMRPRELFRPQSTASHRHNNPLDGVDAAFALTRHMAVSMLPLARLPIDLLFLAEYV